MCELLMALVPLIITVTARLAVAGCEGVGPDFLPWLFVAVGEAAIGLALFAVLWRRVGTLRGELGVTDVPDEELLDVVKYGDPTGSSARTGRRRGRSS